MTIHVERYGEVAGQQVERWRLTNRHGLLLRVLTYGAVVQSLEVPDREGTLADVVLGFDSLEPYTTDDAYLGCVAGRYANRIRDARFDLDGATYELTVNDRGSALHGGVEGFGRRVWSGSEVRDGDGVGLRLELTSPDGDQGFPGTLRAAVTYLLTPDDEVRIDYEATTDAPTVVNLTQHSYVNLAGEGSGSALHHELEVAATHYTPVDERQLPTGDVAPVAGTRLDLRSGGPIDGGLDHNLVLDGQGLRPVARLGDPGSGRVLTLLTTEPGLQVYAGGQLDGTLTGKSGTPYDAGAGVALETQHFPDSPNQPAFPSTVLRPGETYRSTTVWRFTTDSQGR